MSSAAVDALREALNQDLSQINPQIDGCGSMSNDNANMKQAAIDAINSRLERLLQRQTKDMAALAALDDLDADGFPTIPPFLVTQDVLDDINGDKTDIEAAAAGFAPQPVATTGVNTFADPIPKGE